MRLAGRVRAHVAGHPRVLLAADRIVERYPRLGDALVSTFRGDSRRRYAAWVAQYDSDVGGGLDGAAELERLPELSVILLGAAGQQSFDEQPFGRFEVTLGDPSHSGAAIKAARHEHVVLVDGTAKLRPHALVLLVAALAADQGAVVAYGDDDAVGAEGDRRDHYFKPDWNESLLLAQNYLGGAVAIRRSDALAAGAGDAGDPWELLLRVTERLPPSAVRHIPYVISHRSHRPAERDPSRHKARLAHLGNITDVHLAGSRSYRVSYRVPDPQPRVSVIVPSTCDPAVLQRCLDGLLGGTDYGDFEILVVANGTDASNPYLESLRARPRTRVLCRFEPYNFSTLNNWAVPQSTGELLCFLNDDTEVLEPKWLASLVSHAVQRDVGAVGSLLLYPNGRIQHAGVVLGPGWLATHAYRGARRGERGYHDRALVTQDLSSVTAACMLVRRDAFEAVDGFDPAFPTRYNDVDFCLRLRQAGWRIVWTPDAVLRHKESTSLRRIATPGDREARLLTARWGNHLAADPHHNPNLSLDPLSLWESAFPPRVPYPAERATTAYSPVS